MNAIQRPILLDTYELESPEFTPPRFQLAKSHRFEPAVLPPQARLDEPKPDRDIAPAASRGGDTFQLYLREIGQVKLLTHDEEIALAKRIKSGDEEAREQMVKANLRLVVKIARDYEGLGLPLLDLISEGNIGLMKGVERFQPDKGAKLSTYVSWWIKQAIRRALANQSKTIRLPLHVTQKLSHIRKTTLKLRETLDREPTDQELADDLELDPRRVRRYRDASRVMICLDSSVSREDSTPVSETVADENAAAPFEDLLKENDYGMVKEILATLDARESKILMMRFGLDDGRQKTLDEVAEHFGITRERIRQIQSQALEKMRVRMGRREPFRICFPA